MTQSKQAAATVAASIALEELDAAALEALSWVSGGAAKLTDAGDPLRTGPGGITGGTLGKVAPPSSVLSSGISDLLATKSV